MKSFTKRKLPALKLCYWSCGYSEQSVYVSWRRNHRLTGSYSRISLYRPSWLRGTKKAIQGLSVKHPQVRVTSTIANGPRKLRTVKFGISTPIVLSPPLKTPAGLLSRTKSVGSRTAILYHEVLARSSA